MRSVLLFGDDTFKLYWVNNLSKFLKTYGFVDYSSGINQTVYRIMRMASHSGYILLPIYKDNNNTSDKTLEAIHYLDSIAKKDMKLETKFVSALMRRFGKSLGVILSSLRDAMDRIDVSVLQFPLFLFNSVGVGCYFRFMLFQFLESLAWGCMDYFLVRLHTYLDSIGVNSLYYVSHKFDFNDLFTGNDLLRMETILGSSITGYREKEIRDKFKECVLESDTSNWRVHNSVLQVRDIPVSISLHMDIFCDLFKFYDLIPISEDDIKGCVKTFLGESHSSYIKSLFLDNVSVNYICKDMRGTLKRNRSLFVIGVVFNFLFSCANERREYVSDIYIIRFKYVLPSEIIDKFFFHPLEQLFKMYHCLDLELRGIHTDYNLDRFKVTHNREDGYIESSYDFSI